MKRVNDTARLYFASTQIYETEEEHTDHICPYICSLLGIKLRETENEALVKQVLDDETFFVEK